MRVIAALGLAASLTGMVSARPHAHGHKHAHQERDVVVDVVTEIDWVTVYPDAKVPEPTTTSTTSTTPEVEATPSSSQPAVELAVQVPSTSSPVATANPTPIATPTWTTSSSVVASSTSSDVIASATATGGSGVKIYNNLDETVYLWTTSNVSSDMETLEAKGGAYYEDWQINSDGGGISIKLATTTDEISVLQFEYTKEDETIWWDMSSINLDKTSAFVTNGFSVTSNDASCSTVTCDAGDADCSESYQHPDDIDTRSCSSSAAFTLKLGV